MTSWESVVVEAYSGYTANERPLRFRKEGRFLAVLRIVERMREPGADMFLVKAEDGLQYRLRWERATDRWFLRAL
jgi:tricorn protease-like protein